MNKELKKRVITSVLLLLIAILCIVINKVIFTFAILAVFAMSFYEWNNINIPYFFVKRKKKGFVFLQLAGLIYLFIFLSSSLSLHNIFGPIFFIFILLVCASSDIGGYIFGKTIGGIKLTKISPNKTISGSIGSFLFSLTPIFLFNFNKNLFIDFNFTLQNVIFCLIISISCQIGDLIISYFKRLNKIKDTGNILPGHGGLLDRADGIIFAVPIAWILIFLKIFTYEN